MFASLLFFCLYILKLHIGSLDIVYTDGGALVVAQSKGWPGPGPRPFVNKYLLYNLESIYGILGGVIISHNV